MVEEDKRCKDDGANVQSDFRRPTFREILETITNPSFPRCVFTCGNFGTVVSPPHSIPEESKKDVDEEMRPRVALKLSFIFKHSTSLLRPGIRPIGVNNMTYNAE